MNIYIEAGTDNGKNIFQTKETKTTLAKKIITSNNNERFYIKTYRGKIVDPESEFFKKDKDAQKWTSVSEEIYALYLKFLRTGKIQFLTSAERQI